MKDYKEIPDFLKNAGSMVCYHCNAYRGNKEPLNQERGWKVLGLTFPDGTYFAFETLEGCHYVIHISCMKSLRGATDNLELLNTTKRWWLVTEKAKNVKVREYESPEEFRAKFPVLFGDKTQKKEVQNGQD